MTPEPGPQFYPTIVSILEATSSSGVQTQSYYPGLPDVQGLPDGSLVELQCKPVVSTGTDQNYGNYFIIGEDSSSDTLKVYCQAAINATDRINKVSGQLRTEGTARVLCVDSGPGYEPQLLVGTLFVVHTESIAFVRTLPEAATTTITQKTVSADITDFPGAFYVQEPGRGAGIRVLYSGTASVSRGAVVNVTGSVHTASDGEREINAGSNGVTIVPPQGSAPNPVGMPNRSIGGEAFNVLTPGVNYPVAGSGLCNKGLLVKTWGKVTSVDTTNKCFYLDDGTGFDDGSGHIGVKVSWDWPTAGKSSIAPPPQGIYTAVTGISSSEDFGSNRMIRVLRPRNQDDVYIQPPSIRFDPLPNPVVGVQSVTVRVSNFGSEVTDFSLTVAGEYADLSKMDLDYTNGVFTMLWDASAYENGAYEISACATGSTYATGCGAITATTSRGTLALASDKSCIQIDDGVPGNEALEECHITATLTMPDQTPAPDGTAVTFTSNCGSFSNVTTTLGGVATATYHSNTVSGVAVITAAGGNTCGTLMLTQAGPPGKLVFTRSTYTMVPDVSDLNPGAVSQIRAQVRVCDADNFAVADGTVVNYSVSNGNIQVLSPSPTVNGISEVTIKAVSPMESSSSVIASISGLQSATATVDLKWPLISLPSVPTCMKQPPLYN